MSRQPKLVFFSIMLVFLALCLAVIYYLTTRNFSSNSNLFWIGGLAGTSICVFLISTTLLLFQSITNATKKRKLTVIMLIVSALVFAIIYFAGWYSRDSDIWWYGAIAGFLSCLSLAFLILAFYSGYKLMQCYR
jgi:hypothetical protein